MDPGIPNTVTKRIVIKFTPIWKLKYPPIKLIRNKITLPINELANSFNINFSGTINILHNTNKMHIPVKNPSIV